SLIIIGVYLVINVFFFFSSRRRHTRFSRDWSSDVCSSDLVETIGPVGMALAASVKGFLFSGITLINNSLLFLYQVIGLPKLAFRSEERRVGKECRSRWWTYR